MAKLIFGCGYLGRRVALRWLAAGEEVFVVTRNSVRVAELAAEGLRPLVADVIRPETLVDLPAASAVLYAIGYDRAAGATMHEVYVRGLLHVLDALPRETGKFIYVSSTGVYGQSRGEWVNEQSPCEPSREAGRICLEAERALAAHDCGQHAIVLRMAGLYGPGRIPNLAAIRAGDPIAVPEQGWLNLIHVDDAAEVVLAADRAAAAPRTFVVSDGVPVLRREYYGELSRLVNAKPPRFVAPLAESPAALRAGSGEGKRIDSARMRNELRVDLLYLTYREGLAAIVADGA